MTQYNKLVRDKIPAICEQDGYRAEVRIIQTDEEYLEVLTAKLGEESAEVKDNPCLEELADTLEVLRSIGKALGYTPDQIERARIQKAEERGGFDDRVYLIRTEQINK
ncbi:MAG TPA: nucleoside triphosphate pyrophosphohydrolase [Candidatus Saccharimonadales bacterium]|jgi:predicted house-cleaning noncanonical NTP pyrophosphatase (MazG superfamily)